MYACHIELRSIFGLKTENLVNLSLVGTLQKKKLVEYKGSMFVLKYLFWNFDIIHLTN